jgi:tetratricopeptide (TPR) repeat protein
LWQQSEIMGRRSHYLLVAATIILVTAVTCVSWWFYWPAYHRGRQIALAERLLNADEAPRAEEIILASIKDMPEDAQAQFLHARILRKLGRLTEGSAALRRARELGFSPTQCQRESALIEAFQDFHLGEGHLQDLLKADPNDLEVEEALARGYGGQQRWLDAEQAYTHLIKMHPQKAAFRLDRGRVRLELARYDQAATDFREFLQSSSRNFEARLLLAHCLLGNAHVAEAEKELQACRRLQPAHPGPLIGLANCALERGQLDQAQKLIQEARALAPDDLLALHVQGILYLRRRRYDLAISLYEAILQKNPRDKEAHLKLAQALSQSGDASRALKHQEKFEQLDHEEFEHERQRRVGARRTAETK